MRGRVFCVDERSRLSLARCNMLSVIFVRYLGHHLYVNKSLLEWEVERFHLFDGG